jgi:hypothetical protein
VKRKIPASLDMVFFQRLFFILIVSLFFTSPVLASIELLGKEGKLIKRPASDFTLTSDGYFAVDYVASKNCIDLNNKEKKDSFNYIGLDYRINFDLTYKDWFEIFTGFERNGPTENDAPMLGRRSVPTTYGDIQRYRNKEYLPELQEWFVDFKTPYTQFHPVHTRAGLYPFMVGNGLAVGGYYENYGVMIYHPGENFNWRFNYFKPGWSSKLILGPAIPQEKFMGRSYYDTIADLFSLDSLFQWKNEKTSSWWVPEGSVQPYVSFLSDRTGEFKRANLFATQVTQDLLGTFGADLSLEFGRLLLDFESARNFGQAIAKNGEKNIVHKGYIFLASSELDFKEYWLTPRSKIIVASGNKTADSEDDLLHGATNRAFSVYSPLNANLTNSVYQAQMLGPLLVMGNSWGLNYGVPRPGTFDDPYIFENLITPNIGLNITPHERIKVLLDWWYLSAFQEGIGSYEGVSKKLSKDIGYEFDAQVLVELTKYLSLDLNVGYFVPGEYYRTLRDDEGTMFSPLVRGDGDADNAIYFEGRVTLSY